MIETCSTFWFVNLRTCLFAEICYNLCTVGFDLLPNPKFEISKCMSSKDIIFNWEQRLITEWIEWVQCHEYISARNSTYLSINFEQGKYSLQLCFLKMFSEKNIFLYFFKCSNIHLADSKSLPWLSSFCLSFLSLKGTSNSPCMSNFSSFYKKLH